MAPGKNERPVHQRGAHLTYQHDPKPRVRSQNSTPVHISWPLRVVLLRAIRATIKAANRADNDALVAALYNAQVELEAGDE